MSERNFTREFVKKLASESAIELPKEFIDELMECHADVRDRYAKSKVDDALAAQKPVDVKETDEYKTLKKLLDDEKKAHETTKKGIADKEAKEAKRNAVTEYFKGKNISGDNLKLALRGSWAEIDGIELEDGKIKDTKALDALVAGDFAGLVEKTTTSGANTANPPTGYGGGTTAKSSGIGRQLEQEYVKNNYGVKES